MEKIKVLFLDQRTIIRHSFYALYKDDEKIVMVTQYSKLTDWPELVEKIQPDMVIIDVGYHGKEIVRAIKQRSEKVVILALTDDPAEKEFLEFIKLGVKAYLLMEDLSVDGLIAVIELTMKETLVLTRPFSNILFKNLAIKDVHVGGSAEIPTEAGEQAKRLSTHERAVLALTIAGASNREISKLLDIAQNTTKVHLRNIMRKLGVNGKQKLAAFARQHHHLRNDLMIEYYHLKDEKSAN